MYSIRRLDSKKGTGVRDGGHYVGKFIGRNKRRDASLHKRIAGRYRWRWLGILAQE